MKSITYPSISAVALCLLFASVAFAQEEVMVANEAENSVQTDVQADPETTQAETNRVAMPEARETALAERAEVQASTSAAREARQAYMQTLRADRQAELSERTKDRITNLAANISNRMDAAAARMQNIITRLESRINKLEASGLDTTEAVAALASAQQSIDAAVNALTRIDITVQNAVTAENPRAAWVEVKAAYTSIREQLRTANTELRASVQALKDAARTTNSERGSAAAVQTNPAVSTESPDADEADTVITSEVEAAAE
jgi:exonuclease VII small subunit